MLTSKSQARKLILVERLLLSFRLLFSSSLIPDDEHETKNLDKNVTCQCSGESVPESKDGPVKDGNNEDETELNSVDYCPSWTQKRTLELSASRTGGLEKVVEIKPAES